MGARHSLAWRCNRLTAVLLVAVVAGLSLLLQLSYRRRLVDSFAKVHEEESAEPEGWRESLVVPESGALDPTMPHELEPEEDLDLIDVGVDTELPMPTVTTTPMMTSTTTQPMTWNTRPTHSVQFRPLPDIPLNVSGQNPALSDTPYTAAILYMASWRRVAEMITSLSYVHDNLKTEYPWPILLFHPGEFDDPARQDALRRGLYDYILHESSRSDDAEDDEEGGKDAAWNFIDRIEFVHLDMQLPAGLPEKKDLEPIVFGSRWPGYHHMCSFFFSHIFTHPRLANLTYYLRLDSDSYVYAPSCFDPFERMHSRNLSYAYRWRGSDPEFVVHGLHALVDQYAAANDGIEERMEKNKWHLPTRSWWGNSSLPSYYNNFEVVRMERFREPDVQNWLDEVNSGPERIYKWRWGDAPLRFATVNMLLDRDTEVEEWCSLPYFHQNLAPKQCSCEEER